MRVAAAVVSGHDPGPEASVGKLLATDTMARTSEVARLLLGTAARGRRRRLGHLGVDRAPARRSGLPHRRRHRRDPAQHHRRARPRPASGAADMTTEAYERELCRRVAASLRTAVARRGGRALRPDARRPLGTDLSGGDQRGRTGGEVGAAGAAGRSAGTTCCARPASWTRWRRPECRCRPSSRPTRASRPGSPCSWSRASPWSRCSTILRWRRRWPPPGCCAPPRRCRPCTTCPSTRSRSTRSRCPRSTSSAAGPARWRRCPRTWCRTPSGCANDSRTRCRRRSAPRSSTATTASAT